MTTNTSAFTLSVDTEGIARLKFDLPGEKVNKFTVGVLGELERVIDELATRKDVKALLMTSGKPGIFIAGADVNAFIPAFKKPELLREMITAGHRTFTKIENLPFPTVALIDGNCLGGGLECALAFKYRVVTDNPKTLLGLPEVSLGLIPGWGGTQRLPRLIGLQEGLGAILSGKSFNASKAYKMHLADALISEAFQEDKIKEFISQIQTASGKSKILARRKQGWQAFFLEDNPLGRSVVFSQAGKELYKKTKGRYYAPEVALKLIEKSYTLPLEEGLKMEIETIIEATSSESSQAANLIGLFFTQNNLKKNAGMPIDAKPAPISSSGVLGAGTMGAGIAWLLADNDRSVRLKDLQWGYISSGLATIRKLFTDKLKHKKITPSAMSLKEHRVSGTTDFSGFQHVDIVIEAAVEDIEVKKRLFKDLEEVVPKETIIATNTSSLPIKSMSEAFSHPERFLGLHFFNPVNKMPLVEVIPGPKTSQEVLATSIDLCRQLGKTPIVVGDCTGFLVNRVFLAGANEAMWMLQEGIPMKHIENAALNFGLPMSPFLLADEVGNDVCYKVAKSLEGAYGERMHCPEIVTLMADKQLYGKKKGKGFYIYHKNEATPNPEVMRLLSELQTRPTDLHERDIKDRMILVMVNEAARCLKEKIVASPEYLDMAMIMGTGFPPYRGGLLKYADSLGISYILAQLKNFESSFGPRYTPSELLVEMGQTNGKFYPD